ncbi:AAA family ATPase [Acholeplasma equifetale]|uniref:AAA family ATPase n=1 Tax=Acholeplasma equifetale TaxID=264634 RepID=UPI00047BCA1D|nr:AAA family ATPase [Acholeplasma equifetale]
MKFINIFGPGAVGKMSVGQELAKLKGYKLFHNHITIEFVIETLGFYESNTINQIRDILFESFAKSEIEGVIFTFMWAFDYIKDWDFVYKYKNLFESHGWETYYIELEASQETRLYRNKTENRLKHKPSKRDIELSDKRLLDEDSKYRLNSYDGEIPFKNYLKINNENLSPSEVVQKIIKIFDL